MKDTLPRQLGKAVKKTSFGKCWFVGVVEGFSSLLLAVEHLHHLTADEKWVGELVNYIKHVVSILTSFT